MSRSVVRRMKGAVKRARGQTSDREAALWLLARSVKFGHGRLAVIRLSDAVRAGAEVPRDHWAYCAEVVRSRDHDTLRELYAEAARATAGRALTTAFFQ